MALRTEKRTIGDFTYQVTQLGYREGRALLPIVLRAVGPSLGTLLEGMIQGGKVVLDSNMDLSRALSEFSASLTEQDLERITDKLSERSWILDAERHQMPPDESGKVNLSNVEEEHWPPRWGECAQWLAFALEVNFASFLGGAGVGGVLSAVAKGKSASKSPSTSTGDSGGSSAAPG